MCFQCSGPEYNHPKNLLMVKISKIYDVSNPQLKLTKICNKCEECRLYMKQSVQSNDLHQFIRNTRTLSPFGIKHFWSFINNWITPPACERVKFGNITFKKSILTMQSFDLSFSKSFLTLKTWKWISCWWYVKLINFNLKNNKLKMWLYL